MRRGLIFAPAAAALLLTSATRAQEPRAVTLGEALQQAVRLNPTLASATVDLRVAEAGVMEAIGIQDWLIDATGTYYRKRSKSVAEDIVGTNSVDQASGELAISKLLPTGGTLTVKGNGDRSETEFVFGGMKSVQDTASVTAQLDQPLLRGFGPTATYARRTQAEVERDVARLARSATVRTVVRDIVTAYWELAYAGADLEIRRSSLDLARERRRLTEASVKGGAIAPTELLAVDQVIAQREEEVVVSGLQRLQRSLDLRRLTGMEIAPTDLDLTVNAPLEVDPKPVELRGEFERAVRESPEIAELEARGRGAKIQIEVTENGLLPRLDLSLYGGPIGTGTGFGDAVDSMINDGGYQVGGSLRLQHALGNHAARGSARRARAERDRVLIGLTDARAQVARAVAEAVTEANTASRRLELSTQAIALSQRNIKAEVGRFELGKSTNFDVLLRQDELKQARLRYARAAADYLRARAFLGSLTGEILGQYGVKVED